MQYCNFIYKIYNGGSIQHKCLSRSSSGTLRLCLRLRLSCSISIRSTLRHRVDLCLSSTGPCNVDEAL